MCAVCCTQPQGRWQRRHCRVEIHRGGVVRAGEVQEQPGIGRQRVFERIRRLFDKGPCDMHDALWQRLDTRILRLRGGILRLAHANRPPAAQLVSQSDRSIEIHHEQGSRLTSSSIQRTGTVMASQFTSSYNNMHKKRARKTVAFKYVLRHTRHTPHHTPHVHLTGPMRPKSYEAETTRGAAHRTVNFSPFSEFLKVCSWTPTPTGQASDGTTPAPAVLYTMTNSAPKKNKRQNWSV